VNAQQPSWLLDLEGRTRLLPAESLPELFNLSDIGG
jgi:hypothetical protein